MIEICCGSYEDALSAFNGGAKQIELNSSLALGGLTPSIASLKLIKSETSLKVICMVRPRAAGFNYSEAEFKEMLTECQLLLEAGADGIAFGFLNEDHSINACRTKKFIDLIHQYQKDAVFHRAIDVCNNYEEAIETLISLNTDRILTSGQRSKAFEASVLLKKIQKKYGKQIEFLIGSGINADNCRQLVNLTGITNIHSSCKDWIVDPTTTHQEVSFSYTKQPNTNSYEVVSTEKVRQLVQIMH